MKKTKLSDLKKQIIKSELEINDHLLDIRDISNSEHKEREKDIKNIFKGTKKDMDSLLTGLDKIGFGHNDAIYYVLSLLIDYKK